MPCTCHQRASHGYLGYQGYGNAHYGNADTDTPEAESSSWEQYAPLVTAVVEGTSDPHKQALLWEQRLVTLQKAGFSPESAAYRSAEARYQAALRAAGMELEEEQSTREWRALGKAGIATGIVVGIGVLVALGVAIGRGGKK
jgi:hypothetical protein